MADEQDLPRRAARATVELEPGTEVGGYVIEAKIGAGGMGVVYGARHPRIGKRVAIKVLAPAFCGDPATVERFEQEARLVNEIHHPNIVDVFQFGELPDGRGYFVMEWLEGESLSARLDKGGLPATEAIEILDAICDALDAAHEAGVVHRDLKSDNVFIAKLRDQRKVKLLDFGLAKLAGRGESGEHGALHTTKSGMVVGTPAYMSPEQARGKHVDHRTDIYALGCLTYKMLTGRLPFTADNAMDLIIKQLNQPPPSPSKLAPKTPPELSRMVVQMMAKDAAERPTLADVRALLAKLRAPASAPAPAKPRRAISVLVGLALFSSGVVTLGVIALIKQRSSPAPAASSADGSAQAEVPGGDAPEESDAATSAGSAAPAVIEFEEDRVAAPRPGAPAPEVVAPAAQKPRRAASAPEVAEPAAPEPQKIAAGAILLILDQSSWIELDGQVVAEASKGGRFEVSPGSHTLRVRAPGREVVTRTVDVEPGGTAVLRIVDDRAPARPARPSEDGVYDPETDSVVPADQ